MDFEMFNMDMGCLPEVDDELDAELEEMDMQLLTATMQAYVVLLQCFQPIKLAIENQVTINPARPLDDLLHKYTATPQLFKDLTNFTVDEFYELCMLVCPTIEKHPRSTGQGHKLWGRPCRATPQQRVLSFILYMKHDNTIYFDAAHWNWAKASICDNAIFVASCVNEALAHEIRWPTADERMELGQVIPNLPGCIGFVDGTLCKIHRPFENEYHSKWYSGRKNMYCLNSPVLIDHNSLFIFVDPGYPGSYHDVNVLRESWVDQNWQGLFANRPGYF